MENSEQPIVKRQRIANEDLNKVPQQTSTTSLNKLPILAIEIILGELSVTDRLRMERVDWFWNGKVAENGWKGQKKLSFDVVFEGAERVKRELFTEGSLIAFFKKVGKHLIDLDLRSFKQSQLTEDICGFLHLLPRLSHLDIVGFSLSGVVPFLPPTLREIHSSGPFNEESFAALAAKCPNLVGINFKSDYPLSTVSVATMNNFLLKYPGLKIIHLAGNFIESVQNASLTALGQLERLEEIYLGSIEAFGDTALKSLIAGCSRLKTLKLNKIAVSEEAINELDQHPNLVDFETFNHPILTGDIEMEINGRWKIKKFNNLRSRMSTDDSVLLKMLDEINRYLEESQPIFRRIFIEELIQFDLLPLLIKSLNSTNFELQLEAAAALTLIAGGTNKQTRAVVDVGAVTELLKLLGSGNGDLRIQSLEAFININQIAEFRDLCVDLGIIERLLQMVEEECTRNVWNERSMYVLRFIVSLFYIISQNSLSMDIIKAILPVLGKFVQHNVDEEILERSILTLANIADEGNEHIQLVVNLGVVPRLVSLADNSYYDVQFAALFALANIAKGTDEQVQLVLDLGLLKMIPVLITQHEFDIVELCIRFLSNIACKEDRVQNIIDTGLVQVIIQLLVRGPGPYSQGEPLRAISNIAKYGKSEHIHHLVDFGVISPLCNLLREAYNDDDVVLNILVSLKNIIDKSGTRTEEVYKRIKRCPGIYLEVLNLHHQRSEDIKKVAGEIRKFFPPNEEEQTDK